MAQSTGRVPGDFYFESVNFRGQYARFAATRRSKSGWGVPPGMLARRLGFCYT